MPVYVYQCKNCNHVFEQRQSFSDDALPAVRRRNPAQALLHRRRDLQGFRLLQHRQGQLLNGVPHQPKEGRGNTGCPAPRRLRSTPGTDALHDIVTPVRRTLLTHPFQTLALLRGQRLRRSSRLLRTRLLGVLLLGISFLRGSPRGRGSTRSHNRRRRHAHQQRLSPAHRAAAAHTTVPTARLRR